MDTNKHPFSLKFDFFCHVVLYFIIAAGTSVFPLAASYFLLAYTLVVTIILSAFGVKKCAGKTHGCLIVIVLWIVKKSKVGKRINRAVLHIRFYSFSVLCFVFNYMLDMIQYLSIGVVEFICCHFNGYIF